MKDSKVCLLGGWGSNGVWEELKKWPCKGKFENKYLQIGGKMRKQKKSIK